MSVHRVALIFDNTQRPETTGTYCLRALKHLVEVEHFQPHDLDQIPREGVDLYLCIDDGLRYQIPAGLHSTAYWAIDTHLDPAWHVEKARGFDLVFTAQRDGAEKLRRSGVRSATWLPLGCDPEIHGKHEIAKQYDVAFVGSVFPGPRADLLNLIRRKYPNTFIGQCYFEEMAKTYSAARTVFNRSIKNDVNMRVFEALASGSLLVTNDLSDNGLAELFRDGVHLVTYREAEDLLDKLAFYLRRDSLREKIAAAGRAEVVEKHTYRHRMEQVLQRAEAMVARRLVAPDMPGFSSPRWGDIIEPGVLTPVMASAPDVVARDASGIPSPGRGDIIEPGVLTPGLADDPSTQSSLSPEGATPAGAGAYSVSPLWGSTQGGNEDRVRPSQPAAHAAGYTMTPLRGSDHGRGDAGPPQPAAHAAGYTMTPLRGSEAPVRGSDHGRDATPHRQSSAASRAGHDPSYFGHVRPEVLALVPETALAVLDIGCGAGRLGEAIKLRQRAEVIGVELDDGAAAAARARLDQVIVGNVESLDLPFPPGRFDAVVCADILEHLREPDRLLRDAKNWLKPDGALVASIPNVRHHSVVRSILEGNWTYESAGLLDRTHLRFFTRREIEKLFFRAGFAIEEMRSVIVPDDRAALENGNGRVQVGRLSVGGLLPHDAAEFHTYQFLVRARPAPVPEFGLTSIVIVTHNQLEYTRQCLDSIARLTDEPYELIVVDNASNDGTVEYLRVKPGVRLIANESNRGFPAAANQGMAAANGRQILLLNNDVVVTTGWLFRMLRALHSDPAIGLVGPCSNFVSGPQQVETRYDSLADLDGFAWDWGGAHEGQRVEVHRLVGFCLLIRREVVDAIGLLDEQFGVGCFEDDDYCLRAIQAGFRTVIARDAFVHHFGGRTFVGSGSDFAGIMRENGERFRAKWAAEWHWNRARER